MRRHVYPAAVGGGGFFFRPVARGCVTARRRATRSTATWRSGRKTARGTGDARRPGSFTARVRDVADSPRDVRLVAAAKLEGA